MRLFALIALLICASINVCAQTSRGTVSGVVKDSAGAVIVGASVVLTNAETGVPRTTITNDEGFYRFDAVDLGIYNAKITAPGFGEVIKNHIRVEANQIADIPVELEPGTQQVTVSVTSETGALLQTEAPVRGGNVNTLQITELPFFTRNPVSLALTLPGVTTNRNSQGSSTFSVNGARGRSNNFLIDGTENNDISVAGQAFSITNPDSVQEVSVQTSNYDAEFGRAGGAVVNTITKSGGNDFHGTLSTLYDSTRDDAITSSLSRDPRIVKRGRLDSGTENFFTGTFGGPIIRNRTFFFGSYQEDRQRSTSSTQLTTPTAAGRARLRQLFPVGTNANVDLLLSATENTVAPIAQSSLSLDQTGAPLSRGAIEFGTFFRVFPAPVLDRQWMVKVDHKINENNQLSGRFISDRSRTAFGGAAEFEGFDVDSIARTYNFLLSETHVFSPTLTNEARLAYNRILLQFPLQDPNGPAATLPRIVVSSISPLGLNPNFPQGRIANNYTIQDTLTKIVGKHTFRAGVDFLRQISTQAAPFFARGQLTYAAGGGFTSFANFVDNFGGSTSGNARRDIGSAIYFPSLFRTAVFFQDRWNVSSALTLTLGVRYENFGTPINTIRTPAFTGLFNVDPVTRKGPWSEPNKVSADNNNFAPTIGFAYSPSFENGMLGRLLGNRKSVIRGGYQIGYDSFFNNIASNAAVSSPNIIASLFTSAVNASNPRGTPNFSARLPTTADALTPLSSQTLVAPNLVNPYYQRWSLGIQRELPLNLVVDVSYVGSKGTKLLVNEDANPLVRAELRVTPPGVTTGLSGRLDNLQGPRSVRTNGGSSIYHSGQLNVLRRFTNNFTITGSYTWAKLIDNGSEVFAQTGSSTSFSFAQLPFVLGSERLERGLSQFDRAHRGTLTYVYEIPIFRTQQGLMGHLLGGWQLSGSTAFESGVPFTVSNGFDADGLGGNNDRPNLNPNGRPGVRAIPVTNAQGFITGYVNPDANNAPIDPNTAQFIANPAFVSGLPGSIPRLGTLGRNTERLPATNNWDFNVMKKIRLRENSSLEFRTEFYNVFNHPQYTQGSVSPFTPSGGTVGSNAVVTTAGNFLTPNSTFNDGGGRVIRYQLKYIF